MKALKGILLALTLAAGAASAAVDGPSTNAEGKLVPRKYYGKIAMRLANTLPQAHVLQQALNDTISQRAWTNLVTFYDFDHSVFLQSDLDRFAEHEFSIDDELREGNARFGFAVRNLYVERLRERIDFATNLLAKGGWDFSANETYRIRRKDAPWPKTKAEADEHWRLRLKNEVLAQLVNRALDEEAKTNKTAKAVTNAIETIASTNAPAKVETPEENLVKKYRQYVQVMTAPDDEAVLQHYLSAVARAYDPHTDYMSPATKEDFDIEMNLALCGVGAVLSMEDGALKIVELSPGGPIERDGRIKPGDKIVGVQQADGPMEDVTWQPMRQSIKKIRGPKGTRVTLEIIPRSDPGGATRKRYELVRDEIKLEDQAATGRVERVVSPQGVTNKLGYAYLPSFYGTMDKRPNEAGFRSAAMDVNRFVADFNAEDCAGMVLDLRGNGGGSLREAVMLSALFVPEGPVVQVRDVRTVGALPIPSGNPVAFKKPMVVLVDRGSASASEIVAGHLQDTGRAIVLGDHCTHGKGTVQSVIDLRPLLWYGSTNKYGSVKITTARFYRIDGRSTQLRGVESDILLPSLLDALDIGEDKLDNALPFSRILPADYEKCGKADRYVAELRKLSEARLAGNERYGKHVANVKGMKAIGERVEVPLEFEARKKMAAADRELHELDNPDADDEEEAEEKTPPKRRARNDRGDNDVVLDEAFQILSDLIRLSKGEEVALPKRGLW